MYIRTGMNNMKGVLLDLGSLDLQDLDLTPLTSLFSHWQSYATTTAAQLAERIADTEVLISNKVPLDANSLAQAPHLRLICIAATGTNNVDLKAAQERNIAVCNARGYATPSVVEHVFALLLSLRRHLRTVDHRLRQGQWQDAEHFCLLEPDITELAGSTMGIVGHGELGQQVAQVARAFGMQVLLAQRPDTPPRAGRIPLMDLLARVDVLSLHCPLTEATRNLLGPAQFAAMKPGAILLNTARGGIVDESALLAALQSGQLGGAGLDVLQQEPPRAGNPLLVSDHPRLLLTPHIAWASREARQRLIGELAANVQAFAQGEIRNCVSTQ